MVTITVEGDRLVLEVEGWDRLWALRSRLEIPLAHVTGVRIDPDVARRWLTGIKLAGTHIPTVLTAGTFYEDGGLVFWDVHDADRTVVIELQHERYQRLIVEVEHPDEAIRLINDSRAFSGG